MIVIELFWVVFGIGYVIYKGFKEERETTLSFFKFFGLLVLILSPLGILRYIADNDSTSEKGRIIASLLAIILLLALLCFCLYMIYIAVRNKCSGGQYAINAILEDEEKKKKSYVDKNIERIENIEIELRNAGYNIGELYTITGLREKKANKEKIVDAVQREIYFVPLYNRENNRPSTTREIYDCLSRLQRHNLLSYSEQMLGDILGISVDYIPLNKCITKDTVRYRMVMDAKNRGATTQSLQFTATKAIFDSDIKEEARRQRKELMIKRIMQIDGYTYPSECSGELPENCDYISEFEGCFSKKQKLKELMEAAEYHLSNDFINKIAFDPKSPLNSVYSGTPANELYKWLCKVRTEELEKMLHSDKSEFEQILGAKIIEIPPSEDGLTVFRELCAIMYCLEKEGLTIDDSFLRDKILAYGGEEKFDKYKMVFSDYMNSM